jgi:hypothetical protein
MRAMGLFTLVTMGLTVGWLALFAPSQRVATLANSVRSANPGLAEDSVTTALLAMRIFPLWDLKGVLVAAGLVLALFLGPIATAAIQTSLLLRHVDPDTLERWDSPPNGSDTSTERPRLRGVWDTFVQHLSMHWYVLRCPPPHDRHTQWMAFRDLGGAPLLEELLFRCSMCALMWVSGASAWEVTLVTPLAFAGAHLHHAFLELRRGLSMAQVAASTMLRSAYTWVFGALASALWLRSSTMAAAVTAHVMCNFFGFPNVGRVFSYWKLAVSERSGLAWALAVGVTAAYCAGVAAFVHWLPQALEWLSQ